LFEDFFDLGDDELEVLSDGGSTSIIKSGIKVAGGGVSVNGEDDRSGGGTCSKEFLLDEQWLSGVGDAMGLEVHSLNGERRGGPRAGDVNSIGFGIRSLNAGKVGDVQSGIFLGIRGSGDHLDDGGVG